MRAMGSRGFSLLEVMVSVTILMIALAFLYTLSMSVSNSSSVQEAKVYTQDQVRNAMLLITMDLRNASSSTVTGAPGAVMTYQKADDVDGNGSAVNVGGFLELNGVTTIQRNPALPTQITMTLPDGTVRELANDILLNEDADGSGALNGVEDTNLNGTLDRGFWFTQTGKMIEITIQAQRFVGSPPRPILTSLVESVEPRN
jgi:prepilin-type N-terminal cleavage/methylation domain-containing protein